MDQLTADQRKRFELLESSVAPLVSGGRDETDELPVAEGVQINAICAAIIREERLQYRFMVLFQTLVAVLAVLTLALLAWAAWSVANSEVFQGAVAGAGGIATGTGAGFLLRQRKDARDAHKGALASLEKHECLPREYALSHSSAGGGVAWLVGRGACPMSLAKA